ncbi:Nif3-like dinuclear metal center hexameric protein [Aliarcobacter skirrowii]|uniref:GTP cyclohydrolase 1 type 2 homolog n=1 Tax=Aliarcobacter skirrowii TaxID=28200 RepID=A0A2U2C1V3_9BACT|nr:Nif3-like dinuclear metal center hexameric protein [Aliarcobacter skirrowii]MCT7446355.1 Nif3-like dinuclear metal center hexameric protein [Aliarcobacter skirrowii]MDX3958842.1 Nif3-like dinuclear metal center hexameric protein [Aliarcobacter skirrowii]PWE21292.1 Nif3-like dinuclear metal center hexameric protein [Aliarcobacter skirrowii]PWE22298.1 Nif3-like dinuclear metal center hexameric protein [Aliarcobacter skirrowii]PWE25982.1 Nif3-like dinuclear metal center hexameric protein [Alia
MKIEDIYNYLNELSPFELQEKWDNSGLLVGNMGDSFESLYLSMDLDLELAKSLKPNSLVITHHPLIFSGLKRVNYDTYSTKILKELIKKDIALISMHTNIDKTHLNRFVVEEILGFKIVNQNEFIANCEINMSFDELLNYLSKKLNLKNLKYVKTKENINTIAICTGSAMSLIDEVKADCFITGDIKYHDAMEAKARDLSLIDIRHYESENSFNILLEQLLSQYLKKNKLKAIITASKNPFEFFKGETVE